MIHLLRSEWIKFRSVRSTWISLLLAGGLVVLVAVLTANEAKDDFGPSNLAQLTIGVSISSMIFGVLGVQAIGQEYRFNTIRPTFTAAPHRWRVLIAKLIVVTVACAVVAAAMTALCWVIGTAMLDSFEIDGVDTRIAWGIVLFSMLWTMAGMGLGAIVRQPIAGIMILLGYSLVAEGIIGAVLPGTVRWLPFANGLQMTLREESSQLQSVLAGGIYFAVFCAVLWVIGGLLVNKRDA